MTVGKKLGQIDKTKVEFEPADMDYQDRQSGIIDPGGNYWWI